MPALHAVALGGLVALGLAGAPTGALVACGLAAGITIPPVGSVVRPLLAGLLGGDDAGLLPTAYALDGIAIELVFVTGPLLTAAIVVVASPAVALLVACASSSWAPIVLVASPASRAWRPDARDHERHLLGALASPGVRTIVAATAPVGFALGATEVTMTAFATDHGSRAAAGALMAAWAAGSGVGGLAYGGREHASARRARAGCAWPRSFPLCSLPLLLAPSLLAMAPLALDRRAVPGALHGRGQRARRRRRAPGCRHGGLRVADHRDRARRRRRQCGRRRDRAVVGLAARASGRWWRRGR